MLIGDITNSGAIPTLELSMKFAAARRDVIAHNIANIDTPGFVPTDLSPTDFQRALGDAVKRRRDRTGGEIGGLDFAGTDQVRLETGGRLRATPKTPSGNIMFHDRNNRDLERLMQANVENVAAFRVATDLLRTRYDILKAAISERA